MDVKFCRLASATMSSLLMMDDRLPCRPFVPMRCILSDNDFPSIEIDDMLVVEAVV